VVNATEVGTPLLTRTVTGSEESVPTESVAVKVSVPTATTLLIEVKTILVAGPENVTEFDFAAIPLTETATVAYAVPDGDCGTSCADKSTNRWGQDLSSYCCGLFSVSS
jgi:hypothetical protein